MNRSMNTLNFLEANVWLALLWGRHIHSERAREWLERSPEEKFFFLPIYAVDRTPATDIGGNNGT
jgi:hypothetical protein